MIGRHLQFVLLLAVLTILLLLVGWPLAAHMRDERLNGVNFTDCGPAQIGVRVIDLDGNPEHAVLSSYTTSVCGTKQPRTVTLWNKVR